MKQLLLLIVLFFSVQLTYTQVFDVEAIKTSGLDEKRINLVILADGYTVGELTQFETDATVFMDDLFSQEPFASYENYFNVYIIKVISNESGASHPGTAPDEPGPPDPVVPVLSVDNYFGTAYDSFNIHRLLYTPNSGLVSTVLANNFPMYDQALILVNSPYYGGSGGEFPVASTGTDAGEIAIHELGHSFVDLKDEYYPGDLLAEEAINMTQDNNPLTVKWKNWVGINAVGIFPYGASEPESNWFRPHETCKMRYLGFDFCAVCKEGIIEKIHSLTSPIDSYNPASATINNPTFPIDFQLTVVAPIPNTLESSWTLNGSPFATNMDAVQVQESDLNAGLNNLTVVVNDATTLIDIDGHESLHFSTVSWSIDNTLGVQDVEANKFNITMYPNPSKHYITIKSENTLGQTVVVDIISMDGKQVKTIDISNNDRSQINISALSQGLYIANFYANDVLITSKKLIKN